MKQKTVKTGIEKYNLAVVAHPDDETIFMGGLIMQEKKLPWTVLCLTDGNADGQEKVRHLQLLKATKKLGVHQTLHWDFPDIYEKRLDIDLLIKKLKELPTPTNVYTHGPLGEYGHPHHQDVCYATHMAFSPSIPVFSICYNSHPERLIKLSKEQFDLKGQIMQKIYASETNRFLNLIPATFCEGFKKHKLSEVKSIYQILTGQGHPTPSKLKSFKWLWQHLKYKLQTGQSRIF